MNIGVNICVYCNAFCSICLSVCICKYDCLLCSVIYVNISGPLFLKIICRRWMREEYRHQFSSVAQSCLTLCNPMNRSTPGLPVHHQLPSAPKPMSIELVMPSSHLILYRPLLFLPSVFPNVRVFSNESALHIKVTFTLRVGKVLEFQL